MNIYAPKMTAVDFDLMTQADDDTADLAPAERIKILKNLFSTYGPKDRLTRVIKRIAKAVLKDVTQDERIHSRARSLLDKLVIAEQTKAQSEEARIPAEATDSLESLIENIGALNLEAESGSQPTGPGSRVTKRAEFLHGLYILSDSPDPEAVYQGLRDKAARAEKTICFEPTWDTAVEELLQRANDIVRPKINGPLLKFIPDFTITATDHAKALAAEARGIFKALMDGQPIPEPKPAESASWHPREEVAPPAVRSKQFDPSMSEPPLPITRPPNLSCAVCGLFEPGLAPYHQCSEII